ncbi:MAG: phage GP46 family protein [Planctomycetota bacterium]|jgi:phage gp46-like protein
MDARLFFDLEQLAGDIAIESADVARETTLDTAVLLSVYSDRRAEHDDALPSGEDDRRGWWGDSFLPVDGDRFGSRLWLLERQKTTDETLARALEYIRESLDWLVDDGIAAAVYVSGEWRSHATAVKVGRFRVVVERPPAPQITYRFQYVWQSREG